MTRRTTKDPDILSLIRFLVWLYGGMMIVMAVFLVAYACVSESQIATLEKQVAELQHGKQ